MTVSRTVFATSSGKLVDLLDPKPEDINFDDIAEHLSKENRYNGGTPGTAYSVAEHLVRGAECLHEHYRAFTRILAPEFDQILVDHYANCAAGYFLLHDCPEAYLKDDPTPKKRALDAIAQAKFGVLAGSIVEAFDELTRRFELAIADAAGLEWPPPMHFPRLVEMMDEMMLVTEWRDLKKTPMPFETKLVGLPETIHPWNWQQARTQLEAAFNRWLPNCRKGYGIDLAAREQNHRVLSFPDGTRL